jgi:hypothetical protein
MLNPLSLQLRVGVDVGSRCHSVAIGLSDGRLLEEFEIPHTKEGFRAFFARVEAVIGNAILPKSGEVKIPTSSW